MLLAPAGPATANETSKQKTAAVIDNFLVIFLPPFSEPCLNDPVSFHKRLFFTIDHLTITPLPASR
jgi:hypothetical protein